MNYEAMNVYDLGSLLLKIIKDDIEFKVEFDGYRYLIDEIVVESGKIILKANNPKAKL